MGDPRVAANPVDEYGDELIDTRDLTGVYCSQRATAPTSTRSSTSTDASDG
jgi:hypothetical protein